VNLFDSQDPPALGAARIMKHARPAGAASPQRTAYTTSLSPMRWLAVDRICDVDDISSVMVPACNGSFCAVLTLPSMHEWPLPSRRSQPRSPWQCSYHTLRRP
jgi:hypothetical protein